MITAIRNTDTKLQPSFGNLSRRGGLPPTFVNESKDFTQLTKDLKVAGVITAAVAGLITGLALANKIFSNKN